MYAGKNTHTHTHTHTHTEESRLSELLWSESRNQYNTETFQNPISNCFKTEEGGEEGGKWGGGGRFHQTEEITDKNGMKMNKQWSKHSMWYLSVLVMWCRPGCGELEPIPVYVGWEVGYTWAGNQAVTELQTTDQDSHSHSHLRESSQSVYSACLGTVGGKMNSQIINNLHPVNQ